MIKDFIEMGDKAASLFDGLAIMKTSYAAMINSCPVTYLTLKNCKGASAAELIFTLKRELLREYLRYEKEIEEKVDHNSCDYENYRDILNTLKDKESSYIYLTTCLADLTRIIAACPMIKRSAKLPQK